MFRSWLREADDRARKIYLNAWFWGLLERSSKQYLGVGSERYTKATLPLAFALYVLGGRQRAYNYLFPDLRGLRRTSAPVAVKRLLANAPKRLNIVRLAAAIAAPALDRRMVERGRGRKQGLNRIMDQQLRERGARYAVSDATQAELVAGVRRIREDYPYGLEVLTVIARAQDSLHEMSHAEICAVLEVARRTLAVYAAAAEVGQAVKPAVDAHMALRMHLGRHRGADVPIVDVAAAHPHLSFRDFKRAARNLRDTFPRHVVYNPIAFTISVTPELPPDFMLAPLREVSATAIMPTPIRDIEALTAKLADTFRLTGHHAAPTIATRHRIDPLALPTSQPTGPDDVATAPRHSAPPPVSD